MSLLVGLVLAGCGDGAGFDDACAMVAAARCTQRVTCDAGGQTFNLTKGFGSMDTCQAREKMRCLAAATAPSSGATLLGLQACATAIAGQDCHDLLDGDFPATCIFKGQGADGSVCTFAMQCQSQFCAVDKNSGCGTCGTTPAPGASCATTICGPEQGCYNNVCAAQGNRGDGCGKNMPCKNGLHCILSTGSPGATCQEPSTDFSTPAKCGTGTPGCGTLSGLYCDGTSLTCKPILIATDGQPCGVLPTGGVADCSPSGNCISTTTNQDVGLTAPGICHAAVADGQPCSTDPGPGCLYPARCVVPAGSTNGVCTTPDKLGCM
jgi:hypothetical protein